jgi:tetratricopeptide (TPR) repeat protein
LRPPSSASQSEARDIRLFKARAAWSNCQLPEIAVTVSPTTAGSSFENVPDRPLESGMREIVLRQAERFVQQGKLEAALDEYRKILRATPRDLVVANTVGDLYARLGRHAEAIEHYANIAKILETAGHLSRATAVHKKIVKLDPSNAEALRDLAMLYAKQGLVGEAASQYAATAKAYTRAGKLREAVRVLELATEMTPESGRTRLELARALEATGDTREAAEGYRVTGQLFLRRGRTDDAIAALENALALAPVSRCALKMLA